MDQKKMRVMEKKPTNNFKKKYTMDCVERGGVNRGVMD